MMLGIVGRPGAPHRPTDLDVDHYYWFIEGLVREINEDNWKPLDDLYAAARRARLRQQKTPEARAASIDDFLATVFG